MEIDSEVVQLLSDHANHNTMLDWSKTLPVGVSKFEHYQGFAEVLEIAKSIIYNATQKFSPNYMIIASDVLPVITFIRGWETENVGIVSGPYLAGTLNGIKVYVSPRMTAGNFVLGVNGGDLQTSAAVYAPYLPIVPTQLLGFSDGAMSQGLTLVA